VLPSGLIAREKAALGLAWRVDSNSPVCRFQILIRRSSPILKKVLPFGLMATDQVQS